MKKLIQSMVLILVTVVTLFGIRYQLEQSEGSAGNKIINFYNWGDYIDPELITQFEKETGYKIVYETFDSNEAMISKIQQGGTAYDVAVPSDYMIEVMIEKNLLIPLDYRQLDQAKNNDPRFMDLDFDPKNKYSLPYFWGTLGVLYNTKQVPEGAIKTWDDLWKPEFKNQILMIDGAREVIGIGLQSEGKSLNEKSDQAIKASALKMKKLMPNIRAIVADEIKMYMAQNEAAVSVTYSGEAATAMSENEDLAYVVPEDGSNIWFDNIVIPKTSKNVKGAHALINFLMRPDVAAKNAEYIGYATPNKGAFKLMDPEITSDPAFYPNDELVSKLEIYKNLGQEKLIQYNDAYLEVKIEPK
ncbi:ABC transporter substrate-binding protein [Vaginisenegalia massiliensis]|uniref:ABC transporter substrate-binding protein n=1 Tax=Vaginisenegalia massiliensis TaxID=2058294 RepID=UPI000F541EBE|nr:ABC transporter substrate-binding protein [Vaginisenegalia massiliensis]